MMQNNRFNFLGLNLDNLSLAETIQKVDEIIKEGKPKQHVVLNAAKVVYTQSDEKLKEVINHCDIINADGQAVVWATRFLGIPFKERVAGIDLMIELIKTAAVKNWKIYLLGAHQKILDEMIKNLQIEHPQLSIAGYRNGYFSTQEEQSVVDDIKSNKPDILFIGISSPKKENFLYRYLKELKVPFCMGVGGSFDVIAGKTKRAPQLIQKIGLEWLYRIFQEPGRMWKRYAKTNPVFVYLVIKEKFKKAYS